MELHRFIAMFCLDKTRVYITSSPGSRYFGCYVGTIEHLRHNPDMVKELLKRHVSTVQAKENVLYISLC